MKKILLVISLVALGLNLSAAGPGAGEKLDLRLHLQKGESYNLREINDQNIAQTIQGYKHDRTNWTRSEYRFDVEYVDPDGTASVKTTFSSCALKLDGPDGTFEYDSANPTEVENPILKFCAALIGKDFRMKITPLGRVREVTGIEAETTRILEGIYQLEYPQNAVTRAFLKNQFADQAIREKMSVMFANYPDHPVSIGDSWTGRSVVSRVNPMIIESTWTLKDRREGRSVIEVDSRILANPEALPLEIGQMKLTQEVTGEMTGTLELNEATGWIMSGSMDMQLSGEIKIEGNPQLPEGMIFPMTSKTAVKLESF
jgi:hypothetical protein